MGADTKRKVSGLVRLSRLPAPDDWPPAHVVVEGLLLFAARAALGLFLSSLFGVLPYLVLVPVVESIWKIGYINFALMGVVTVGFGAGVGSFLGWFSRGLNRPVLLLMLVMSVAAAMLGAWGGLKSGEDVYKLGGLPGIPALSGIIVGAILGGNIFNVAVWLFTTLRNPRIR